MSVRSMRFRRSAHFLKTTTSPVHSHRPRALTPMSNLNGGAKLTLTTSPLLWRPTVGYSSPLTPLNAGRSFLPLILQ